MPCVYRLQYKYMKLVVSSSSSGGSGQLPAAETCALDDDDDDDDGGDFDDGRDFPVTKVRKGARFFHKLKMSTRPSTDSAKVRPRDC